MELVKITPKMLFNEMGKADKIRSFSFYFWHLTSLDNAIKIIENGCFYSRNEAVSKWLLQYDNYKKNNVTKQVVSSNVSKLTSDHVRFYLRPANKPFFSLRYDMERHGVTPVLFAVNRSALIRSNNPTFLYPVNAHYAQDYVYDSKYALNNHNAEGVIMVNKKLLSNLKVTYSKYDPSCPSDYQSAEFLVYKSLSTDFVSMIYFLKEKDKIEFVSRLSESKLRGITIETCSNLFEGKNKWLK